MNIKKTDKLLWGLIAIIAFVLASCAPQTPKPWNTDQIGGITFEFKDTDPDGGEIGGDVILDLGGVGPINGVTHYIIYWSGSSGKSGKGDKLATVEINRISGKVIYTVNANTKIPKSRNQYFLLYATDNKNPEFYTRVPGAKIDDLGKETKEEAKAATAAKAKAAEVLAEEKAEAKKIAEAEEAEEAEEAKAIAAAEKVVVRIENILFDYDRAIIKSSFKRYLQRSFDGVKNIDKMKLTIEGHCDERGSNEYNLALGERRAHALKRYLITLGFLEENIETLSYGEEKPFDPRHSEDAWRRNRRAQSEIED